VELDSNGSLIALVVIVGLIGFALAFVGGRETSENGSAAGIGTVIDQSVGMHVIRRLTGRSSDPPADDLVPPAVLTADEVAYRIGTPGAAGPERHEAPGPRLGAARAAAVSANPATAPRRRLLRDSGAVLVALSGLALIGIGIFPGVGGGGPSKTFLSVSRAQSTPTSSPSDGLSDVLSETSRPTAKPSAPPAPTPGPTKTKTTTPAKPASPKPTPRPTPTPTPTPTPKKATPKPTASATPTPTPPLVAKITEAPSCGDAGVPLQFAAQSMPGASYDWDFQDGSASGRVVTHSFSGDGTYTVTLTVIRSGDRKRDSVLVSIPC
jgi:PKD domain